MLYCLQGGPLVDFIRYHVLLMLTLFRASFGFYDHMYTDLGAVSNGDTEGAYRYLQVCNSGLSVRERRPLGTMLLRAEWNLAGGRFGFLVRCASEKCSAVHGWSIQEASYRLKVRSPGCGHGQRSESGAPEGLGPLYIPPHIAFVWHPTRIRRAAETLHGCASGAS